MQTDEERYNEMVVTPALNSLTAILNRKKLSNEQIESTLAESKRKWTEKDSLILNRLHVTVTTRCSLSCIHCSDLMPLYQEPYDAAPDELIDDINTILESVDTCVRLEFVGGEPFLYKPLTEIITAFHEQPKVTQIELITNGTITPKDSALLDALKHPKVFISISDYGNIAGTAKLVDSFERNQIAFEIFTNIEWIEGTIPKDTNRPEDVLIRQYNGCNPAKYCKTLLKRHIYPCSRAAHLSDLGLITSDRIAVYRNTQLRNELKAFLTGTWTAGCRYCNHGLPNNKRIIAGEQKNNEHKRSQYMLVSREWYKELSEARDWLEGQYLNYKRLYEEQQDSQVERGLKKWLKKLL